jgi:hypothetical protein
MSTEFTYSRVYRGSDICLQSGKIGLRGRIRAIASTPDHFMLNNVEFVLGGRLFKGTNDPFPKLDSE